MGKNISLHGNPLEKAVTEGNKARILRLLRNQKLNMKTSNKNEDSMLHLVLRHIVSTPEEIIEILTLFLEQVDPNTKNKCEESVLHLAVAKRDKSIIDFLLMHNAKIDDLDSEGNTIAHMFITDEVKLFIHINEMDEDSLVNSNKRQMMEKDSADFVEWLLSKGFDFDCQNKNGQSALHMAIAYNLQHILPILFIHTKDINYISKTEYRTLLSVFLKRANEVYIQSNIVKNHDIEFVTMFKLPSDNFCERYVFEIVKILLHRGVTVDHIDNDGLTALHIAIYAKVPINVIEILINEFTQFDNKNMIKLIHQVVKKAILEQSETEYFSNVVHILLYKGVNINIEDENGLTPVYYVVKSQCLRIIELMRKYGVDLTVVTENGKNALFWLIHKLPSNEEINENQENLFSLLLNVGCDVNALDINTHKTPLFLACESCKITIVKKLVEYGAKVNCREKLHKKTPLHVAVNQGNVDIARLLLEYNADVNRKDRHFTSPLHIAAKQGHLEMAKLLLNYGSHINTKNICDNTPLHLAVQQGYIRMVQFLLRKGANINSRNNCNRQPIHLAVQQGLTKLTILLLNKGAHINCRDSYGNTPLHYAVMLSNNKTLLKLLLKRDALVNARNKKGESPFVTAIKHEWTSFVELENILNKLLKYGAGINNDSNFAWMPQNWRFYCTPFIEYWVNRMKEGYDYDYLKTKCNDTFVYRSHDLYYTFYRSSHPDWLKEIRTLKTSMIASNISLYDWLNMQPNQQIIYNRSINLQKIILSPNLKEQFPYYSDVMIGNYRKIGVRKWLLQSAKESWVKLVGFYLPDMCLEYVFAYLNNGDLVEIMLNCEYE